MAKSAGAFRDERAWAMARPGSGYAVHRVGTKALTVNGALCNGKRLHQLHAGRRGGPDRAGVRRELSPVGGDQAALRPRQPVPGQPECKTSACGSRGNSKLDGRVNPEGSGSFFASGRIAEAKATTDF